MRAYLIYNPNSGGIAQVSVDELLGALYAAGFDPLYEATSSEEDLDAVLEKVKGLVVAVGGDGTVRAVATRLIGKKVPLAILPAGTANNIWHTFLPKAKPLDIVAGLKEPVKRHMDICRVHAPWGVDYFLELFGFGLYADILNYYEPEKGKSIIRSITALVQTLSNPRHYQCQIYLDGKDISGDYLLFEVINTTYIGPAVKLAPEADPTDGQFEVVRIREDNRDGLLAYVSGLLTEELGELPSVDVSHGRRLEILCKESFPFHVDAEVRPKTYERLPEQTPAAGARKDIPQTEGPVLIDICPHALELWLPKIEEPRGAE